MAGFEMTDNNSKNKLVQLLDESLDLLKNFQKPEQLRVTPDILNPSLLDQCLEICQKQGYSNEPEPIRMLLHFGIPLDSKLIPSLATLPNTCILTDIYPNHNANKQIYGQTLVAKNLHFINQHYSTFEDDQYKINRFIHEIELIKEQKKNIGQRLLICDNYSRSLSNTEVQSDLLTLISGKFNLRPVIIMADPVKTYQMYFCSQQQNSKVLSFEEYCSSVLEFVETHSSLVVIKHEDFISDPESVIKVISDKLNLPFIEDSIFLSDIFESIGQNRSKENLQVPLLEHQEVIESPSFISLSEKFGYSYHSKILQKKTHDLFNASENNYLFKNYSLGEIETMASNENLQSPGFASSILLWLSADWNSLINIEYEDIYLHNERERFALMLVRAYIQLSQFEKASDYARLAIEWGCPQNIFVEMLIKSLNHNGK